MPRLLGWLLGSGLLLYLGFTVYTQRAEIAQLPWRLSWHPFACVVCLMVAQSLVGFGTWLHLRALGGTPGRAAVLRVHFLGQVAKYLPLGGVLNVTTQTVALRKHQPGNRAVSAVLLNLATTAAVGVSWFGLLEAVRGAPLLGLPLAVALAAMTPLLGLMGTNLVAWITRGAVQRYRWSILIGIVLAALAAWALFGLSLVLLGQSLVALDLRDAVGMHGLLPGAWALGVASFVVPAGLGIRDGALTFLLAQQLSGPLPGVLALMHRLLWLLADVLNAAWGGWLLARPRDDSSL